MDGRVVAPTPAALRRSFQRTRLGRVDGTRPSRHERGGGTLAFPRRLSKTRDVHPRHRAAAALSRAVLRLGERHPLTRGLLRALIAVGMIGPGFHAYGIGRGMGGWRNWSQNLLNGPPLPAPPAFTALAIAGLAALDLIEGSAQ